MTRCLRFHNFMKYENSGMTPQRKQGDFSGEQGSEKLTTREQTVHDNIHNLRIYIEGMHGSDQKKFLSDLLNQDQLNIYGQYVDLIQRGIVIGVFLGLTPEKQKTVLETANNMYKSNQTQIHGKRKGFIRT